MSTAAMDDTGGIENALVDVTNTDPTPDPTPAVPQYVPRYPEAAREAREQGWPIPQPFDYEKFERKDTDDWAGVAARYEWKDEYGDVGPPNPELEEELFHNEFIPRVGQRLDELNAPHVTLESPQNMTPINTWEDAGLHPLMLKNIELCMYGAPTTVQCYSLPIILQGHDLIGIAQTGSGKTAAFFIPILSKLMGKAKKWAAPRPEVKENFNARRDGVLAQPLVLVVCPTRELATQIFDEARRLCYRSMLRPCVVYGGAPTALQRDELRKGCDILIGTPGRILDFMGQPQVLTLSKVKFTVVDEADELLHEDWEDDLKKLMSGGDINEDADHQYMMFSATFNRECRSLARKYLSGDYVRVRIGRAGSSHLNVHHRMVYVEKNKKKDALVDLLMSMLPVRTLVFVNSKQEVDYVDDHLYHSGFPCTSLHGDRTQREREDAIRSFRTAVCPIMIATSVSARGLDIINVMHVINYDLPRANLGGINEYIHRIGRTARIGNEGIATSFYNERDSDLATKLVKILIECGQPVPDFLELYRPHNNDVTFSDDDTDAAEEAAATQGADESKPAEEFLWDTPIPAEAAATQAADESKPAEEFLWDTPIPAEAAATQAADESSATKPAEEPSWETPAKSSWDTPAEPSWQETPQPLINDDDVAW